jgi:hypothetical protein
LDSLLYVGGRCTWIYAKRLRSRHVREDEHSESRNCERKRPCLLHLAWLATDEPVYDLAWMRHTSPRESPSPLNVAVAPSKPTPGTVATVGQGRSSGTRPAGLARAAECGPGPRCSAKAPILARSRPTVVISMVVAPSSCCVTAPLWRCDAESGSHPPHLVWSAASTNANGENGPLSGPNHYPSPSSGYGGRACKYRRRSHADMTRLLARDGAAEMARLFERHCYRSRRAQWCALSATMRPSSS